MPKRIGSLIAATTAIAAASLATSAASALATDRYVDDQGTGSPPCIVQTNPCPNLTAAVIASGSGDLIHVGGTATEYDGNLSLGDGVSLVRDPFASGSGITTTGTATINTIGNANPAITVAAGTAARTISGFTLRGGNFAASAALLVADNTSNVTILGNVFDDHSASVSQQLRFNGGGTFHVNANSFIGANDGLIRRGISYGANEGGSIEIGGNSMTDLFYPIQIGGVSPPATVVDIHDNEITDVYDDGPAGSTPSGIFLGSTSGRISDNLVTEIAAQPGGNGLVVSTGAPATGIPLEVARNRVYGFASYSQFSGAELVVLTDDVFANNGIGLGLFGTTAIATGITATGNSLSEIHLSTATLSLDSSFVGPLGVDATPGSACSSAFSATSDSTPDCGLSQVADPMFSSAAGNDLSLLPGSPLIDAGNPASPAAGETDIDGNPRAVAVVSCPARRDIGAYELNSPRDCTPPVTTSPDTAVSGKRKVRTRKKKARVTFTFSANEPGATFACSLDGRPFSPCTSPFTVKLRRGAHTLTVRATDPAGNTDPTPASFTTKVKRKK